MNLLNSYQFDIGKTFASFKTSSYIHSYACVLATVAMAI